MHRGYIKIWRKIEDNGLLLMPNTLALFMRLLFTATYKPMQYGTKHGPVPLIRGQGICAIRPLSLEMKQSVKQIRTALEKLEKLEIVALERTHLWTIYTIVNYDKYQEFDETRAQPAAQEGHSKGTDRAQEGHSKGTGGAQEEELKHLRTKELKELKEGKSKTLTPAALLASLGIDEKVSADWITLRKQKKAAVTQTAIDGIAREAEKAGFSLESALRHCCERGWVGFNAEWVLKNSNSAQSKSASDDQAREEARARLFGGKENAAI